MAFYRNLPLRGAVWQYRIGKRFVGVKDPDGRRTQYQHTDFVEDPDEREYYIRNVNDRNVKLAVTPAMVRRFIEKKAKEIS